MAMHNDSRKIYKWDVIECSAEPSRRLCVGFIEKQKFI